MIVPPYITRALKGWTAWREARQRQKRFVRMLMVNPDLRLAHERLERDRKRHARSLPDIMAMRESGACRVAAGGASWVKQKSQKIKNAVSALRSIGKDTDEISAIREGQSLPVVAKMTSSRTGSIPVLFPGAATLRHTSSNRLL